MKLEADSPERPPGSSPTAGEVREHLQQLCQAPPFRTSPRSVRFLTYVVEETLAGRKENLKERSIGVVVFNRPPDYDSDSDPVVRQVAVEVRKRLVQYYAGPGSHHRLRIDIPHGSYAASFRELEPVAPPQPAPPHKSWKVWAFAVGAAALIGVSAIAIGVWVQPTPLDMFWEPVLSGPSQIILCIGKGAGFRASPPSVPAQTDSGARSDPQTARRLERELNVHAADALVLSRLSAFFAQNKKSVLARYVSQLTFAELRENPAVLIGAFNNEWSLKLTGELRYQFKFRDSGREEWVEDTAHPETGRWGLSNIPPDGNIPQDYAIITRVLNQSTGRMLVVLGGLTYHATLAAGEFVTNSEPMRSAQSMFPNNWRRKNLQVVLTTKVTANFNGPPQVIAVHVW